MKAGWPAKQDPYPDSVETPIQVGKRDFGSRMVPPRRSASNQMAKAFTWVRPIQLLATAATSIFRAGLDCNRQIPLL